MTTIIRDDNLKRIPGTVKPDSRRRVVLPIEASDSDMKDIIYHVYRNSIGQIILDPQVTVPASELWLFENKAALASVYKGMEESKNGQVSGCGSFAKYVKDEI
jgi:hypothetical protein